MAKHALVITGGSNGIGFATVKLFTEHGWDCINLSRHPCHLEKVKNIAADLMESQWQFETALIEKLKSYDKIVVVHNAASCYNDSVDNLPTTQLRNTLELNVVAPNRLNQLLISILTPGSAIIYIGSTLAEKAVANSASYVVSKHAIAGLMKATCQDLADTGIHTACVCPGITDTEMLRNRVNNDPDILQQLANIQTANRLVQPDEIADVIYFCATHPVMNGAVVHSHLGQRES